MQVRVKLFANFRAGRFSSETHEYAPGTRIADVIEALQIAESEIGMIMVNNRHAEPHDELQDGASLALFPVLGGG